MTWGRHFDRLDPAKALEIKQQGKKKLTCLGCKHLSLGKDFYGRDIPVCSEGLQPGERCKLYDEKL